MYTAGADLYQQLNCASCHETGENNIVLYGLAERLGYTAVMDTLRAPRPPMPVFPLTEQQQRQLAVYLLRSDNGED